MSISYRKDIEKRLGIDKDAFYQTRKATKSTFTVVYIIQERVCNLYLPNTIVLPSKDDIFKFKRYKSRV